MFAHSIDAKSFSGREHLLLPPPHGEGSKHNIPKRAEVASTEVQANEI